MIRRPPRSTLSSSSAASDVYKRQLIYGSALRQHEAKLAKKKRKKREEEEGKTHVDGGDPDGSYSVTHHFDKDEEVGLVSFTEVLIYLLVPLGAFLGVLGVVMTLKSA